MNAPAVSVLLPVYNARKFIKQAVKSILTQTLRDFELVIINDGSTDGSESIVRELAAKDSRIVVISRPNTGIVGALNDGLTRARSDIVARMDADDLSQPTRLEEQLAELNAHHDCVAVGTWVRVIDEAGRPIQVHCSPTTTAELEQQLLEGNGGALIHPTMMARKQAILTAGKYREEYRHAEDVDLYFRLLTRGRLGNVPKPLLDYRIHGASINHVMTDVQYELVSRLVREAREQRGLPDIVVSREHSPVKTLPGRHRQIASRALGGCQWWTAVHHSWVAFKLEPRHPESRKLLSYSLRKWFHHLLSRKSETPDAT